jgi:hypothetical protein
MIYLAGMTGGTLYGIRDPNRDHPVIIDRREDYINYLVQTYGGEARQFTGNHKNKSWWGWYLTAERKYELFKMLEESGHLRLNIYTVDGIRFKLQKAAEQEERNG